MIYCYSGYLFKALLLNLVIGDKCCIRHPVQMNCSSHQIYLWTPESLKVGGGDHYSRHTMLIQPQLTFSVHFSPVAGYRHTDSFLFPCWFMTARAPLLICSLWQHYHPFLVQVCAFLPPSLWIRFGSATSVWVLYLHLCWMVIFLLFLCFPTCTVSPFPSSVPSRPSTRRSPVEGRGFFLPFVVGGSGSGFLNYV